MNRWRAYGDEFDLSDSEAQSLLDQGVVVRVEAPRVEPLFDMTDEGTEATKKKDRFASSTKVRTEGGE
jgi:hypothetical protein